MSQGLPDHPPEQLQFIDSPDDESCPDCGWDSAELRLDIHKAYGLGILLAVEAADASPFKSMGSAEALCLYFKCPNCQTYFTTEEESLLGGMS